MIKHISTVGVLNDPGPARKTGKVIFRSSHAAIFFAIAVSGSASAAWAQNFEGSTGSATGFNSVAIGAGAQASGSHTVAISTNANASVGNALAIGLNAISSGSGTVAIGAASRATLSGAVAYGANANAIGGNAVALGQATTAGGFSVALGNGAAATGEGSVAIGSGSDTQNFEGATALGRGAVATADDQIMLGQASTTVESPGILNVRNDFTVTIGDTSATPTGPITDLDVNSIGMNLIVDDRTGNSSRVEVSATTVSLTQNGSGYTASNGVAQMTGTSSALIVGGSTRMALTDSGVNFSGSGGAPVRLSGVADGVAPTDAVNVRQLGAMEDRMSAGIAGTMAMTQLPSIAANESFSLGVALGHYNGQSAMALGGTARLQNSMTIRAAAQYSDAGGLAAATGIGWSW